MSDPLSLDPAGFASPDADREAEGSRLERLFERAVDLSAEKRDEMLRGLCSSDPELARELTELLEADESSDDLLEVLADELASTAQLELERAGRPDLRIGPYRLLEVLGRGGMGVVYRAVRDDGQFEQEVALKLLHLDMDSPELRARFLAERQLLARVEHPGIARLVDGGVTPEDRPYLVMERIEGLPITEHCREAGLPVREILGLFLEVVDAVAYLHRHLVVHRDLKPANILVDGFGRPRLLDFGIAKILQDSTGSSEATRTGEVLLTPGYAAPEQRSGEPITTATDVYSLGVLLYELLAGVRPGPQACDAPLPPPPSRSRRRLSRDLDHVCLQALQTEPHLRYATAAELRHDLERHLEGLPIRARPATLGYRLRSFVRRHRRGVGVAIGVVLLLTTGLVREVGLRTEAERAGDRARAEAAKAAVVSDFLADLLSSVDPRRAQGREVAVSDVLAEASRDLAEGRFADQPLVEASLRVTIGKTYTALSRFDEAQPHLERAVELWNRIAKGGEERLDALEALGRLHYAAGNQGEAQEFFLEVLDARRQIHGEEHPATLRILAHLASSFWAEGRLEEVEAMDRRLLEIRRRTLGEEHPETLRSKNGLAATLFSLGRWDQAAVLFAEALEAQERSKGPTHPETLQVANNLGAAWLELGRYREAERLMETIYERTLEVLGPEALDTRLALQNLGLIRSELGLYEEARRLLGDVVTLYRQGPGNHPLRRLGAQAFLGDVLVELGRFEEADEIYRSCFAELEEMEGERAAYEARRVTSLRAELDRRRGDLQSAESRLAGALAGMAREDDEGDPARIRATLFQARLLRDRGDREASLEVARRAEAVSRDALGAEHPVTLDAELEVGRAAAALGMEEEAASVARRVLPFLEERVGPEHPDVLEASRWLGSSAGNDRF